MRAPQGFDDRARATLVRDLITAFLQESQAATQLAMQWMLTVADRGLAEEILRPSGSVGAAVCRAMEGLPAADHQFVLTNERLLGRLLEYGGGAGDGTGADVGLAVDYIRRVPTGQWTKCAVETFLATVQRPEQLLEFMGTALLHYDLPAPARELVPSALQVAMKRFRLTDAQRRRFIRFNAILLQDGPRK